MNQNKWILSFSSDCNCGTTHSIQSFEDEQQALAALSLIFDDCLDCAHLSPDDIEFDSDGSFIDCIDGVNIIASTDKFYISQKDGDDYYIAHGVIDNIDISQSNVLYVV